jgi:type VI secretion system protein ImpH
VAPKKRESRTSLKNRLAEEFYRFSFFRAVDLLESLLPNKKPLGQTLLPSEEAVRFLVKPGFAFPPSDILSLEQGDEENPAHMAVTFLGLIGPNGVLPDWYNELAAERNRYKDFSFTAFLDIFHHRLITLFYLAWKKHRFPENYLSGAKDRLSRYLLSLSGLGTPGLSGRIGLPEESLPCYSGFLSMQIPSAAAIEATVEYFSGTIVEVEQFIERIIFLSPEDQTQLGSANAQLGVDTVCGSYVWDCQTKFRLKLGPMPYDYFLRFLPSGDMLGPIFSLVKYMVGMEYEFETCIYLRREEIPPCILGTETQPRLGWTTWIKSPEVVHESDPFITFHESDLM